jgi:hypothetical protein
MTHRPNNDLKARAEAAFRKVSAPAQFTGDKPASASRPVETTEGAMDEYRARQKAERAKTAKLKALRLAAETKAGVKPKTKAKGRA